MTCVSSLSPLSLRLVRSIKPNTGLTASVAALMTGIIILAADLAVAQVFTHGPVVGGVTDSGGNQRATRG